LGGSYGRKLKFVGLTELAHFDGAAVRDGVRGDSNGVLHRRWMPNCTDYDEEIVASINHTMVISFCIR
jgi:hypothetical protein